MLLSQDTKNARGWKKHQGPRNNGSSGVATPIRWQHLYHMFKMDYFRRHLDMVSQSNATPKFVPDFGTYSVYAYSYF